MSCQSVGTEIHELRELSKPFSNTMTVTRSRESLLHVTGQTESRTGTIVSTQERYLGAGRKGTVFMRIVTTTALDLTGIQGQCSAAVLDDSTTADSGRRSETGAMSIFAQASTLPRTGCAGIGNRYWVIVGKVGTDQRGSARDLGVRGVIRHCPKT